MTNSSTLIYYFDVFLLQISPQCRWDLKEFVLGRKCKKEEIISFLSQVASALHYLHVHHIVHGDLRAQYVNVVSRDYKVSTLVKVACPKTFIVKILIF